MINTRPGDSPFEEIQPCCVSANDLINPLPPSLFYGSGWSTQHPPPGTYFIPAPPCLPFSCNTPQAKAPPRRPPRRTTSTRRSRPRSCASRCRSARATSGCISSRRASRTSGKAARWSAGWTITMMARLCWRTPRRTCQRGGRRRRECFSFTLSLVLRLIDAV
jgi:hypothetical protein